MLQNNLELKQCTYILFLVYLEYLLEYEFNNNQKSINIYDQSQRRLCTIMIAKQA